MLSKTIVIKNKLGLHARAAGKLVDTTARYQCNISVSYNGKSVDGKSIMSVMLLAAAKGSELELSADGPDENDAIRDICALIDNLFDEEE